MLGREVEEAEQRPEVVAELLGGVAGMFTVFGVSHLGEHLLSERLDGLGQGVEDVRALVHPTPLLFGLGEHVSKRRPEPERTVSYRDDRCPHVAVTQVPEQRRPGVGGLPVAVRDRDELLLAVEAHTDDHETAQPFLLEANVEVDPVSPEVHVVPVRQVAGHEGAVLVLPGRGEPGDHRSRQPSRRTEEPLEGRDEVACRQSVQVQQRQDLGDLRRPPTPRRDDDGLELGLFTGRLVDTTVVHPRCFDLDRSGHGLDLASPGVAVSRHETVPVLITLVYELGEIRVDLGLQGSGQHRPRTFAADLVKAEATFRARLVVVHYAQHRRPFLAGALTPAARSDFNEEGTSRLRTSG